jgi:hypothetical protein
MKRGIVSSDGGQGVRVVGDAESWGEEVRGSCPPSREE